MIKVPVVFLQFFLCIDVLTWTSLVHAIKLQPARTNTIAFEGASYAVTCESQNEVNIEWYRRGSSNPIPTQRNDDLFVEQDAGKSRLLFPAVKPQDEGHYECKAGKSTAGFDLKVLKHLKLIQHPDTYYALLGDEIELKCGLDNNYKPTTVVWLFNDKHIEGNQSRSTLGGLFIPEFNETQIGNYTCTYYFTDADISDAASMRISVKQAKKPVIEEIYVNNTLHVLPSTTANIKCKVTAEPSAKIQWYRKGAELDLRKSNATVENRDNESILKVFYSDDTNLGNFTCNAWNKFGNTSKTFNLITGKTPEKPTLSVRKAGDRSCPLDIYPNPPKQNLLSMKVFYKNQKLNNSDWSITSLPLEKENPYSLDQLEPSSFYNLKVEVCSDYDICIFSNDEICETAAPTTGSASTVVQNIITQIILLLPAFIIGFYSQ